MASWSEIVEFSDMLGSRQPEDGEASQDINDREETFTPTREARASKLDGSAIPASAGRPCKASTS